MAQTSQARRRFGRATTTTPGGRFTRSGGQRGGRFSRTTPASRPRPSLRRRRQEQQSGLQKALASVTSMLGSSKQGRRPSMTGNRGRRAGGMALLAGAAGLFMKNRNRIGGMMGRGGGQQTV